MHKNEELNTAWELYNLLEELSRLLFDRYHHHFVERILDERVMRYSDEYHDEGNDLTPDF
jgi:hypothetical protein